MEPWENTISAPIKTIVIIKGANQYFFRTFKKSQISLNKSMNASILKYASEIYFLVFSIFPIRNLSNSFGS